MFPPLRLREAMTLGGLTVRQLARRTWEKINENEIMTRAAAVAFYAMMALVPFLGLVITLAAQLLPDLTGKSNRAEGIGNLTVSEMERTLKMVLPNEAYGVFEDQIRRLQEHPPFGLISLGIVITLWLASSLFVAIIDAMNRVYGVAETRSWLKIRLTAVILTVVQAAILVGSLVAIVAWPQIMGVLGLSQQAVALATAVKWVVVTLMVLFSFALTFFFGPDADQRWEWITPGSIVGTIAFLVESLLFRVYVQNFAHYDRTYGALGGVMVLLFWFWISSVVLLSAGQTNKLIEDASPLGKCVGQKTDPTEPPDLKAIKPDEGNGR